MKGTKDTSKDTDEIHKTGTKKEDRGTRNQARGGGPGKSKLRRERLKNRAFRERGRSGGVLLIFKGTN